ncbi:MAG: hypothetical protein KME20_20070 [Kaiparowitsia implicata GSE-PSE-MK54-09C]|nr:hypothetical protein [Kaiparowitsia implicata GSE-PSE-MK54-09C]
MSYYNAAGTAAIPPRDLGSRWALGCQRGHLGDRPTRDQEAIAPHQRPELRSGCNVELRAPMESRLWQA